MDISRARQMTDNQILETWKRVARYAIPTAVLMFAAIMVGAFSVGLEAGFAGAAVIWVVCSVVGVRKLRAWKQRIPVATLLMLGANLSLAAGASASASVPAVPVEPEPVVMAVYCMDADGTVEQRREKPQLIS